MSLRDIVITKDTEIGIVFDRRTGKHKACPPKSVVPDGYRYRRWTIDRGTHGILESVSCIITIPSMQGPGPDRSEVKVQIFDGECIYGEAYTHFPHFIEY